MSHTDFLGTQLSVGAVVAVAPKGYRGLVKATVEKLIGKQSVKLVYFNHSDYLIEYTVFTNAVIKI